tara:strand:+ start:702 stop:956 length:255 start_codon:yes stop_codon:yes gene_type:complete
MLVNEPFLEHVLAYFHPRLFEDRHWLQPFRGRENCRDYYGVRLPKWAVCMGYGEKSANRNTQSFILKKGCLMREVKFDLGGGGS